MEDTVYDFGLRIRELRNNKGLTQKQVAEMIGLTESAISNYERNVGNPGAVYLRRLALLFGVSSDYLLGIEKRRAYYLDDVPEAAQLLAEKFLGFVTECFQKSPDET